MLTGRRGQTPGPAFRQATLYSLADGSAGEGEAVAQGTPGSGLELSPRGGPGIETSVVALSPAVLWLGCSGVTLGSLV